MTPSDLNITLEEENLDQLIKEISVPKAGATQGKEEDMDMEVEIKVESQKDIVPKYNCDICNKYVMTAKGLKLHKIRMHEKSLQRLEREMKQNYSCDLCDIKRSSEVLLKSHMKIVHSHLKRDYSEMRKPKTKHSPPSSSPPFKKVKENSPTQKVDQPKGEEENRTFDEEDLEARIEVLRRPRANTDDLSTTMVTKHKQEIDNLERLLTASGEVIANLETENNQLHAKAEFYEEVAEGLVVENESLLLKLQQKEEEKTQAKETVKRKEVSWDPIQEQRVLEEEEKDIGDDAEEEDQLGPKVVLEQTGFRQQGGRFTCIVCGITRNTQSQMIKHMKQHKEEGEFVEAGQVHCGLVAFPECPFQCRTKEELMLHIDNDHKKQKCNFCTETFENKDSMESHRKKNHPTFKPCFNISDCSYGIRCHFSHIPMKKAYRCFQCGDEFNTRSDMMVHRKETHQVEDCREFLKDAKCRYKDRCWWAHPFESEGFWDASKKQTPPNKNTLLKIVTPAQNVERGTMKEDMMIQMMNVMSKFMNMQMNQ